MAANDQGGTLANLRLRFGEGAPADTGGIDPPGTWERLAARGVIRRFRNEPLPAGLIDTLCALALSSPTKSDLQQRDILIIEDPSTRARINELVDQDWLPACPHFLVFLGNNRRQRQIHEWRDKPFANDHLDAFFNAAVDAGIALSAFVIAAEAAGLGCVPVSVIRNRAEEASKLLGLPNHVFPVAGLGLGWPERDNWISLRLPLTHTVHRDRFREEGLREAVDAYDARRQRLAPYRSQRDVSRWGETPAYGWSEDKARQYGVPERADWGQFVKRKGFRLE
ncbi:MAG: nitroreductase family protein [Hyphomicrobiaceae bacterium]